VGLASAADDQHGVFGQDGFNSETRHRGFVGGGICRAGNGGRLRGTKMPALRVALFESRMSAPIGEWTERVMISGSIFVQYSPQVIARITEDEKAFSLDHAANLTRCAIAAPECSYRSCTYTVTRSWLMKR
jgi:hypothetical protein